MPQSIQKRISDDVQAIAGDAAFRDRIVKAGSAVRTGSAAEFAAAIEDQRSKIAAIHKTIPPSAR
jgi:tripartite-type tricarboxylate transporter receptor subunit TctC